MRRSAISTALLLLVAGCPSPELPPPDDGPSVSPPDLTEALGPDEARAGMLTDAMQGAFIGGAAAECQAGDFLLYNDRARFAIRGLRKGHWYMNEPGSIIDVDVVRPPDQAGRDGLDDLATAPGLGRLFHATAVDVIADGRDGGPAVIEMTGHDTAFRFLEGAIEAPGFFAGRGLEVTQTYTLFPASPVLEVTTTVTNASDEIVTLDIADIGMVDLATMATFTPGVGFESGTVEGGPTMLAMVSHRNDLAVAVMRPDGAPLADAPLQTLGDVIDLLLAMGAQAELAPGDQLGDTRLVGAARDLATLEEVRRGLAGIPTGVVEGTLVEADGGAPIAGARVFLTDPEGAPWTVAVTGHDGSFRLAGPPGDGLLVAVGDGHNEPADLPAAVGAHGPYAHASANELALRALTDPDGAVDTPFADGYGRSEPVAVTLVDGETVARDLELVAPAMLIARVQALDGTPMPGTVQIRYPDGEGDPQPPDGRLGERRPGSGARKVAFVVDGEMAIAVPPGTYDVVAHRGFRHEIVRHDGVELASGETRALTFALPVAYETPGWVSIDSHVHATPSIDGKCTMEERIATVAAADVQVHVSSDHDHIIDYRPVVAAMDLGAWMISVPGDETSSLARGHHNIFPAEPDPALPNGGAPLWWEYLVTTSELYELFREPVGDEGFIQVNHGHSPGMFSICGFDPTAGEPADPEFYCEAFDAMEILNGKDYGDAELLREDWCAHLDKGLRPTAVGVSDSHTRWYGPGRARSWVRAGVDEAEEIDPDALFAALKADRAVVSGGPFVQLEAVTDDGQRVGVGETLHAGAATLEVQVLAPSWMPVEELRLYSDGCEVVETHAVADDAVAPLWFDLAIPVDTGLGSYFFVEVRGSEGSLVWPGSKPYAMTNPIHLVP